jgi:hypothetical protein
MSETSARPKRWGLRTLAWLTLAAASVVSGELLRAAGQAGLVPLTFVGTCAALVGAAVCSVRGIRAFGEQVRRLRR